MKVLLFGHSGWIGSKLVDILRESGEEIALSKARMENRSDVINELETIKPTHVLCAAGVTGRPNVDWCESNREETIRVFGVHCTLLGTGCIYEYNDEHPMNGSAEHDQGFTEHDAPNFFGSFYSKTKAMVEELLKEYSNVCVLRLRMPISDDLHERNFIYKITKYEKVVNIPNSMSVLTDLLPAVVYLARNKTTGILNFTNPGVITHNEILDLYRKYIDASFVYSNFTEAEQDKILKARRSNNRLDCTKLMELLPENLQIPHIQTSIPLVFQRMKENLRPPPL